MAGGKNDLGFEMAASTVLNEEEILFSPDSIGKWLLLFLSSE